MQDIFARMTLYNLASLLRLHASFMQLKGEYLYRVNDAFAAHIAREFLLGFVSTTKVESLITSFLLPVRPDQPKTRNMREASGQFSVQGNLMLLFISFSRRRLRGFAMPFFKFMYW